MYTFCMSTKKMLEKISEHCLDQLTRYKYAKHPEISEKARRGKIAALDYVQELIYHFFEKDKLLKKEFTELLDFQMNDMESLKDGEYKDAILDVLVWVQKQVQESK